MASELKPCPLCGSEPRRNGRLRAGGVICTGPQNDHHVQAYGADQDAADVAWNQRATPQPAEAQGMVERVTQAILHEARINGAESPQDYGDAEQLAKAAIAALSATLSPQAGGGEQTGWIVTNADGTLYRCWIGGFTGWTTELDRAVRYARREDAEAVHAEDEDAWCVKPFPLHAGAEQEGQS